jgi:PAS domain S-box-containing protein
MSTNASHGPLATAVHMVLEAAPAPVVAVDADRMITYVNALAVELFGHPARSLLGQPVSVVLPAGPVAGDQHTGVRRDGSAFPADVTLTPLETEEGPLLAIGVRDITRRQAREEAALDLGRAYLSLVEMYDAIVRAPDEATLLSETCRIAVEHAGYLGAWVARVDDDGVVHQVASAGALDDFLAGRHMTLDQAVPDGRGPTAMALREGRPVFSSELRDDPSTYEVRRVAREVGIHASATLPLRRDGRTVAVLALYSTRPHFFDGPMRALVAAVSENVSLALERFVIADRLRAVAAQRRDLARRLVVAQEEERRRIAADVHDDSVQSLAAVDLRLGLLRRQLAEAAPDLVPGLEQVQQTVAAVGHGLRDLLFDLETTDASLPLSQLLREAADHLFDDSDVRCTVSVDTTDWDGRRRLAETTRVQALRIVKEAMINVRKHARATHVLVRLVPGLEGVDGLVSDDGVGFDADTPRTPRGHRGLANMRDRASVSGGWCRVESTERGTTVTFWMPYDANATDWMAPEY